MKRLEKWITVLISANPLGQCYPLTDNHPREVISAKKSLPPMRLDTDSAPDYKDDHQKETVKTEDLQKFIDARIDQKNKIKLFKIISRSNAIPHSSILFNVI